MTHPDIRIALVTGANKGIGLEIARQLGMQGMRVLVGARDQDRGQAAAAALAHEGISARDVQLDLTEPATIGSAAADIEAREGRLDIHQFRRWVARYRRSRGSAANLRHQFFRHAGRDAGDAADRPACRRVEGPGHQGQFGRPRLHGHGPQPASRPSDHTGGSGGSSPFGPPAGRRAHGRVLRCRWSPALIGREQAGARPSHSRHCAPSMTYSVPVIDAARGDTKKAMRSATSFGLAGPPVECRRGCRHKVLVDLLPLFGVVESAAKPPPGALDPRSTSTRISIPPSCCRTASATASHPSAVERSAVANTFEGRRRNRTGRRDNLCTRIAQRIDDGRADTFRASVTRARRPASSRLKLMG
jgi:hypothetical protein